VDVYGLSKDINSQMLFFAFLLVTCGSVWLNAAGLRSVKIKLLCWSLYSHFSKNNMI
jgi:hypothetical protein